MGLKKMRPTHYVAVFGGAVAGSEAAFQLSQKGIRVAVFEQNALPYGKIEAGLPKWHHKLRDRQEKIIDEKKSSKQFITRRIFFGLIKLVERCNSVLC